MSKRTKLFYGGLVALLALMVLSAFGVGAVMHESDQASFMSGALQLSKGESSFLHPNFYEYDKFYGSYWLLAVAYRMFSSSPPLLVGNAFSFTVFWLGVVFLFWRTKPDDFLRLSLFAAVVCSPAILVHVPYFAANFVSAGLLFGGGCFVGRRFWLSLICWGAAMSARMDAVLLVPLLAWICCPEASLKRLVCSWRSWGIFTVAGAVFLIGKGLASESTGVGYEPFLIPKLYIGYLVFGMGGGFFALLLLLYSLFRRGVSDGGWDRRLFWWGGAGSLLIPFCFYSALMFSTRHWVVCLAGMLLVICSERGKQLINSCRKRAFKVPSSQCLDTPSDWLKPELHTFSFGRSVAKVCSPTFRWLRLLRNSHIASYSFTVLGGIILSSALLPLVIGLHLPFINKPSLTISSPTLFPTADGRCPMGAVFPFLFSEARLDHNHQVWLAAESIDDWQKNGEGLVSVAASPLDSIVRLAIRVNGQEPTVPLAVGRLPVDVVSYIPCRTLLKSRVQLDQAQVTASSVDFNRFTTEMVGGEFPAGLVALQGRIGEPEGGLDRQIQLMRRLFNGNEFRWLGEVPAGVLTLGRSAEGCRLAFYSAEPFKLLLDDVQLTSAETMPGLHSLSLVGAKWYQSAMHVSAPVFVARSVYPDYMNLNVINGD